MHLPYKAACDMSVTLVIGWLCISALTSALHCAAALAIFWTGRGDAITNDINSSVVYCAADLSRFHSNLPKANVDMNVASGCSQISLMCGLVTL